MGGPAITAEESSVTALGAAAALLRVRRAFAWFTRIWRMAVGGAGEAVRAVVPFDPFEGDQLQIGLVHQTGRIQRASRLGPEPPMGEPAEMIVHDRDELVERA